MPRKKKTEATVSRENLVETTVSENSLKQEQIRVLISNIYDLQKLRISAGNRLVQSIYLQLGVAPGMSPDAIRQSILNYFENDVDSANKLAEAIIKNQKSTKKKNKDAGDDKKDQEKSTLKILDLMLKDYTRITDIVADNNSNIKSVKSAIKHLLSTSEVDEKLNIIRDENDVKLISSYKLLLKSEEESIAVLDKIVKQHPMWDRFFSDIRGVGPLMAGMCLAYFDPYKARHVSSFFKYAGLDVVQDKTEDGEPIYLALDDNKRKVKHVFDDKYENGNAYVYIDTDEVYTGAVVTCTHGRNKGDTEMLPYYVYENGEKVLATDDDGNIKLKRSITYNPKVKTKLVGVLSGCLIKAKDPYFTKIYYDMRFRYDNSEYHKDKSAVVKNKMAIRYMIKEFLRAMWIEWRTLEGLPVDDPYEVAKLGHEKHVYDYRQYISSKVNADKLRA